MNTETKPISARIPVQEVDIVDAVASNLGVDRTTFLRRAIKYYIKELRRQEEGEETPTVVQAAKRVARHDKNALVLDHPFSKRIMKDGIDINDDNGNRIARITNLVQLMNFVEQKVFQE